MRRFALLLVLAAAGAAQDAPYGETYTAAESILKRI